MRLFIFFLGVLVFFWIVYWLRSTLLPFLIGIVIAYILLPLITWAEKRLPPAKKWYQARRVVLILALFILIAGVFGLLFFYIATVVASSFMKLLENSSEYVTSALDRFQEVTDFIRRHVPPQIQQQMDQALQDLGTSILNALKSFFIRTISLIPGTVGLVLGFAALPLFLFYLLKDWTKLRDGFYAALTPWAAEHARNIISIIDVVLGRYIRAQLLLTFVVAVLAFIGLAVLQVPFFPLLALFAGLTEAVPTLGPWIGGVTAVIITLASAPEKALLVAILYLSIQLLENTLLVPRIHGGYLHIHPVFIVLVSVVAAYFAGLWGLILAAPLTAVLVQIYTYMREAVNAEDQQPTK